MPNSAVRNAPHTAAGHSVRRSTAACWLGVPLAVRHPERGIGSVLARAENGAETRAGMTRLWNGFTSAK